MVVEILLWISAVILVALGIAGLLFPALPGAPVLFAGLVVLFKGATISDTALETGSR